MDFINDINEKTIVIVPKNIKEKIIEKKEIKKELVDIKVMDLKQFTDRYYFKVDEKAVYYVMKYLNVKYDIAKMYTDYLIYIDERHELFKLKKKLEEEQLLYYDFIFKKYIKDYDIVVYGYDYIPIFEKNMLQNINAKIIDKKYRHFEHIIYEADTIDEEVEIVAYQICELLKNNIDIKNIKLANVSSEYIPTIRRIFKSYNLPIQLEDTKLYNTTIGLYFLNNLDDDIEKTIELVKENFDCSIQDNQNILNQIIDIVNDYRWTDSYIEIKQCLENAFKVKIQTPKLKNSIEIIDIRNNYIKDEDYVFLMSFNQNIIPTIHKDEDYIKDSEKNLFNLETSSMMNKIEKEIYHNILDDIKNLVITYKLHGYYEDYYISSLNYELNYKIMKYEIDRKHSYSKDMNKFKLSVDLDDFLKYGTMSKNLPILFNNYNTDYLEYKNEYQNIDSMKLQNYIKSLRLSYSSITNYYKCPFKYYISNVLKLDNYETSFEAFVGSVFHNVLSKNLKELDNFDTIYCKAIDEEKEKLEKRNVNLNLTAENEHFLDKLKPELKFIIDTIKKQYEKMSFDESLYEKYIEIKKDKNIPVTFNGYIDKILLKKEKEKTYATIIDYKTGIETIDLKNVEFGLNMQLPVYLYLLKNYEPLKDAHISGFYLQKLLSNIPSSNSSKSYSELKEDTLKLEGYSNSDQNIISKLDKNYMSSKIIKGLRTKNDGSFYSTSKVLSDEKMNNLSKYVDKKIEEAITNILNADFDIKPKRIDDQNVSCEYCQFKDLCYFKEEDIVDLNADSELKFLGCDNND